MRNFVTTKKGYIGSITAATGMLIVYGLFNGAQASHFCEAQLVSATQGTVTYSCLNPLPEGQSGAIAYGYNSKIFIDEVASPETKVSVCTATGSSQPCVKNQAATVTVMSGVILNTANSIFTLVSTGSVSATEQIVLAPRDYTGARRYLNFTFDTGSGQTASGNAPAFARFEIVPCNLSGVGC